MLLLSQALISRGGLARDTRCPTVLVLSFGTVTCRVWILSSIVSGTPPEKQHAKILSRRKIFPKKPLTILIQYSIILV